MQIKLKSWRLIDTGLGTAEYNMAVDEALLYNFKENDSPILRLYRWEPSLSLGRFSDINNALNLESLKKQKLHLVRRMTGGGILVHGGDLSYSLIVPREILKDISVKESYRYLCQFLIKLYKNIGLSAEFAQDLHKESKKSNICMAGNEPYDIIINGKKIGGNAQRYTKKVLFQHGSIPLTLDEPAFKDIFSNYSELKYMATLEKMGKNTKDEELAKLLVEAFSKSFEVSLIPCTLNLAEQESAVEFLRQKYSLKSWNMNGVSQ